MPAGDMVTAHCCVHGVEVRATDSAGEGSSGRRVATSSTHGCNIYMCKNFSYLATSLQADNMQAPIKILMSKSIYSSSVRLL